MTDLAFIATCWTTAGDFAPVGVDSESLEDFQHRVRTASAAGFSGIGLNYADLTVARSKYGDAGMRSILDDNGITHFEIELLTGWYKSGEERRKSDNRRRTLLEAAESIGAALIKVIGDVGATSVELDHVAEAFRVLARQAADAGARLGIESCLVCDLATPNDVLAVVDAADHPAGGVVLDNWQIARAGVENITLRAVPQHRIASVELSDGPREPECDFLTDCFQRRGLPGSGQLDVVGFIDAVRDTGFTGPWGVEILNTQYRSLPITEAIPTALSAAMHVLNRTPRTASGSPEDLESQPGQ